MGHVELAMTIAEFFPLIAIDGEIVKLEASVIRTVGAQGHDPVPVQHQTSLTSNPSAHWRRIGIRILFGHEYLES
jgi:hypothetical protein